MTPEERTKFQIEIKRVIEEQGKKMWDDAIEACVLIVETDPALTRAEMVATMRRVKFSVTPEAPR